MVAIIRNRNGHNRIVIVDSCPGSVIGRPFSIDHNYCEAGYQLWCYRRDRYWSRPPYHRRPPRRLSRLRHTPSPSLDTCKSPGIGKPCPTVWISADVTSSRAYNAAHQRASDGPPLHPLRCPSMLLCRSRRRYQRDNGVWLKRIGRWRGMAQYLSLCFRAIRHNRICR
jgi:hypothetical protein